MGISASEIMKLNMALDNIKAKVLEACAETISEKCDEVYNYAKARVPVQTGNLKSSLKSNKPAYNVGIGNNEVFGEVHFGEKGHIGGWFNTEAFTYMWKPGYYEDNWYGKILYDGWDIVKDTVIPDLISNIKSKL